MYMIVFYMYKYQYIYISMIVYMYVMYYGQVKNTSGGVHINKINIHALKPNITLCLGADLLFQASNPSKHGPWGVLRIYAHIISKIYCKAWNLKCGMFVSRQLNQHLRGFGIVGPRNFP